MGVAVTPTLFVKTDTPSSVHHVNVSNPELAAQLIKEGSTVQVPSMDVAYKTLILLGLRSDVADMRMRIATYGPTAVSSVDPNHPVPLAPGGDDR